MDEDSKVYHASFPAAGAEQGIKKYHARLETMVKERTAELTRVKDHMAQETEECTRAQKALLESEDQYRILVENSGEAICVLQDGLLCFVNSKAVELSGFSKEQLISEPFEKLLHPEDRERVMDQYLKQRQNKDVQGVYTFRLMGKKGRIPWVEFHTVLITWHGKPATQVFLTDITRRKQAEDALQESEQKAGAILNHTFQFIGLMSTKGILIDANKSALELSGISKSDVIGEPFWETPWWTHSPELQKRLRSAIKMSAKGNLVRFEATHPAAEGGLRFIDFSLKPVTDKTGKVVYLIPEGRDITERKIMEEELKEHRNRLEVLVRDRTAELTRSNNQLKQEIEERKRTEKAFLQSEENYRIHFSLTSDVMYFLDDQFRVMNVSPSVENAIGYKPEEIIGRSFDQLGVLAPDSLEKAVADMATLLSGKNISTRVYGFITIHGTRIFGEVTGVPLKRKGKVVGVVCLARDITKRKQAEEELIKHRDHLEELVSERTTELTNVNKQLSREILKQIQTEEYLKERQARLDSIFRAAPVGIGVIINHIMHEVNDCTCEMTGYTREELAGSSSRMLYATKEEFDLVGIDKKRQMRERGIGYVETNWKRKDGSIINMLLSSTPIVPENRSAGVMFIALDITKRKQAEEALRESERKYRALIETTGTGFVITDKKGNVIDANPEYVRLTGHHDLDEICGRSVLEWTVDHERGKNKEAVSRCFHDGIVRGLEINYTDTRGNITPVEINATVVGLDGEPRFLSLCRDITERKRTEKDLRILNKQLENIIEFLPDATFIMDRDKRIIAWNRAMEDMTGVSKEHVLGKDHYNSTVPFYGKPRPYLMDLLVRDDEEIAARYAFLKRKGDSVFCEVFAPALNNGKGAHIWAVASPLYDSDGTVTGAIESIRDITDHKQTLEALKESEGKYRFLTEKMNDLVWIINTHNVVTYVSPSVKKILGYSPQECIGLKTNQIMTPESYAKVVKIEKGEVKRYKKEGIDTERTICQEIEYYCKDGTIKWMESVSSPFLDESGNVIGVHGVSRDITDRKQAEEALKESLQHIERQMLFLKAMLSAIPTPVFFKDTKGRYLGCNRAFSEIAGISQDKIRGKTVFDIWPDEFADVYHDRDLELIGNPMLQVYEWKLRDKADNARDVIFSKDVFRNENGDIAGIVGAFIDITDRKRAEEELRKHRDKLEEMIKVRTADLTKAYERLKQENEARKTTESVLRAQEIELEQKQLSLKETNIALRVLLQKREEDKTRVEETIMTNIKTAVFPYIEKLKNSGLREGQNAYLSEIELHLREIASTYIKRLSTDQIRLSPSEIQVASLIKEGKSSKEIAELLNVSLNTVLTHRFCIRKKTGLKGKKINLVSYLQTLT